MNLKLRGSFPHCVYKMAALAVVYRIPGHESSWKTKQERKKNILSCCCIRPLRRITLLKNPSPPSRRRREFPRWLEFHFSLELSLLQIFFPPVSSTRRLPVICKMVTFYIHDIFSISFFWDLDIFYLGYFIWGLLLDKLTNVWQPTDVTKYSFSLKKRQKKFQSTQDIGNR